MRHDVTKAELIANAERQRIALREADEEMKGLQLLVRDLRIERADLEAAVSGLTRKVQAQDALLRKSKGRSALSLKTCPKTKSHSKSEK